MSANLPNIYGQQFATTITTLVQQKESRLRGLMTSKTYEGKQAQVVDQVSPIEMQAVVGRFSPIQRTDAVVDSRWVVPSDYDLNQIIDTFDKLKLLLDPTSAEVQSAHYAANRKIDDIIISNFFAGAMTGEKGQNTTNILAANQVSVSYGAAANTNLTVAKLRKARMLLRAAEVDLEADPVTIVVSASQEDSLFQDPQYINKDYNGGAPVLEKGKLVEFMGFNFVHSERLPTNGSGYRRIPVFSKSGMHVGLWKDITTDVSKRNDLTGVPYQAYVMLSAGATRLEEKKFVEIPCDETAS